MRSIKFKSIIYILLINLVVTFTIIQLEKIKENKNLIINFNAEGNLFSHNFYNLIIYGPSSSVASSSGEIILHSNFKNLQNEIYEIVGDEIGDKYKLLEYIYNKVPESNFLDEIQFNLNSKAFVKLDDEFDSSKIYLNSDSILKKIKKYIKDKLKISKNMIEANIENNLQELQFFIDRYGSDDQSDENKIKAKRMKSTQQSLIYDKERLFQLIDKNEKEIDKELDNLFVIKVVHKIDKTKKVVLIEVVIAYLILFNAILFIVVRYFKTKN